MSISQELGSHMRANSKMSKLLATSKCAVDMEKIDLKKSGSNMVPTQVSHVSRGFTDVLPTKLDRLPRLFQAAVVVHPRGSAPWTEGEIQRSKLQNTKMWTKVGQKTIEKLPKLARKL